MVSLIDCKAVWALDWGVWKVDLRKIDSCWNETRSLPTMNGGMMGRGLVQIRNTWERNAGDVINGSVYYLFVCCYFI